MFDNLNYNIIIFAICFMVFDFVTGFTKAIMQKEVSSAKMREGLFHKFGFLFVIALAVLVEVGETSAAINLNLPFILPTCSYVILTEITSILENIKQINPQILKLSIFDNLQNMQNENVVSNAVSATEKIDKNEKVNQG